MSNFDPLNKISLKMPVHQNATKRNIISFTIAFAISIMAISIQNSMEEDNTFHNQLEASVKHQPTLMLKE